LKEKAKYCVILVFETVIYQCKLLGFKNFESLVFDLSYQSMKNWSFLSGTKLV